MMKEASFYKPLKEKQVQCQLCPHSCIIENGRRGRCGVRQNIDGTLYTLVYNRLAAAAVDPIEKKPLFHFHPGASAFSIATAGCNLSCSFCQNFGLSQQPKPNNPIEGQVVTPVEIVEQAKQARCSIIAYTYAEPTIAYEYWLETMEEARRNGLLNVWVTNGFINPGPLKQMAGLVDAANIDLKSFNEEFYKRMGGLLKPVLVAIKLYHKLGIHIEITTLVIPGENDSFEELTRIARFIAAIDENIPWHISRFFPMYKMRDGEATPKHTLKLAKEIGEKAGLKHIHLGNVEFGF